MLDTESELDFLVGEKILTKIDDFYVYGGDLDSVSKRLKGNVLTNGNFEIKLAFDFAFTRILFAKTFPFNLLDTLSKSPPYT